MFTLKPLPYKPNALEPTISGRTLDFHYNKHHVGYLNKLNELSAGKYNNVALEDVIRQTCGKDIPIFNNAAQVYNHSFYWDSMTDKYKQPPEKIMQLIKECFGSYEKFAEEFVANGVGQFGSGWVWLIKSETKGLEILKTANADTPIAHGLAPLITCDVWEHAYYLDYQNRRPDYLKLFLEKLVNWEFAEQNL